MFSLTFYDRDHTITFTVEQGSNDLEAHIVPSCDTLPHVCKVAYAAQWGLYNDIIHDFKQYSDVILRLLVWFRRTDALRNLLQSHVVTCEEVSSIAHQYNIREYMNPIMSHSFKVSVVDLNEFCTVQAQLQSYMGLVIRNYTVLNRVQLQSIRFQNAMQSKRFQNVIQTLENNAVYPCPHVQARLAGFTGDMDAVMRIHTHHLEYAFEAARAGGHDNVCEYIQKMIQQRDRDDGHQYIC